jgi:hypothetical protein
MSDQDYYEIQGTDLLGNYPTQAQGTNRALKGKFNGPTEPPSPTAYQDWLDTTTGFWKQRNSANDAWIVMGLIGVQYSGALPLTGGTMTGDISLGTTRRITNMAPASAANDAVRKAELDLKANIASPVFTTDAQLAVDPPTNNSLTRKIYNESRYLKLTGGTMTGQLTLGGIASSSLHAVPLDQLKTFVVFNTSTGHRHDGTDARKVRGINLDAVAAAAGAKLTSNGDGTTIYSLAQPVVPLVIPVVALNVDPAATSYTDVNVAGSVTATSRAVLLAFEVFDNMVIRVRPDGSASDSTDMNINLNTSNGAHPGRSWWVELPASKVFEYKKVSGTGSNLVIRVLGYGQL